MKSVPTPFKKYLMREAHELATLWRIERQDGAVFGYTSHDEPISVGGLVYQPTSGMSPSAVQTKEGLNVDNLEIDALALALELSEDELLAGRWDFAKVLIFQVSWSNPSLGQLILRKGTLGEISFTAQEAARQGASGQLKAELRGLMQPLQQVVGEVVSKMCRASLGDARCGVNLASLTVAGVVTGVTVGSNGLSSQLQALALTQSAGYFDYGLLKMISGANAGLSVEVHSYTTGNLKLFNNLPRPVAVGDGFTLSPGCDRHFATCIAKFNNAVNFRGEPHLPGQDKLVQSAR